MKQVVRLTEQDIQNIVKQVINESTNEGIGSVLGKAGRAIAKPFAKQAQWLGKGGNYIRRGASNMMHSGAKNATEAERFASRGTAASYGMLGAGLAGGGFALGRIGRNGGQNNSGNNNGGSRIAAGPDPATQQPTNPTQANGEMTYEQAIQIANQYKGNDGYWLKHLYDATHDREYCQQVRNLINANRHKQQNSSVTGNVYESADEGVIGAIGKLGAKYGKNLAKKGLKKASNFVSKNPKSLLGAGLAYSYGKSRGSQTPQQSYVDYQGYDYNPYAMYECVDRVIKDYLK